MLYIVPTPIGNLGDITIRALEVLKSVDLIAAEDTRRTLKLMRHYEIECPLISYHEHNEQRRAEELANRLSTGETIALVTDAGTPGVSDPGFRLLRECINDGIQYTVLPGSSALTTAVVACGYGGGKFYFGGFLPVKSGQRARDLGNAIERKEFTLFFETPHRLLKSLAVLADLDPGRKVCVCRELTKQHEEIRHGNAQELLDYYTAHPPRGEIVLAIDGSGC